MLVCDMGCVIQGVIGICLCEGDEVVSMVFVFGNDEEGELFVISECGFGKCIKVSDYLSKGRGGLGVIIFDVIDKIGKLVMLVYVVGNEELMVLIEKGIVICICVEEVCVMGCNVQGVKVINIGDKDCVIDVFLICKEDEL